MDKQEYLNQISSSVRPSAPQSSGLPSFFSSTIFKVIIGGLVAFIFIAIIGSTLSSGSVSVKDEVVELNLYLDSTMSAITTYQPGIKSSSLRSASASLYSILSNTSRDLDTYLSDNYTRKETEATKAMEETEALHSDSLTSELFNAKINGILDRIYAHKMSYEITMIMSKESSISDRSANPDLKSALSSSYTSLSTLSSEFNNFSETN